MYTYKCSWKERQGVMRIQFYFRVQMCSCWQSAIPKNEWKSGDTVIHIIISVPYGLYRRSLLNRFDDSNNHDSSLQRKRLDVYTQINCLFLSRSLEVLKLRSLKMPETKSKWWLCIKCHLTLLQIVEALDVNRLICFKWLSVPFIYWLDNFFI